MVRKCVRVCEGAQKGHLLLDSSCTPLQQVAVFSCDVDTVEEEENGGLKNQKINAQNTEGVSFRYDVDYKNARPNDIKTRLSVKYSQKESFI